MSEKEIEVKIGESHPDPFHDQHDSHGFRREEKWTLAHETLCKQWRDQAQSASDGHNAAGKKNKFKHVVFGLPSVLLPIIFSPVSIALENDPSLPYVSMVGFIATGLFGAIDNFFNYSGKTSEHMNYSAQYADIVSDIDYELVQGREYRVDSDRFLMKIN
jgi:hypothetical protein